MKPSGIIKISDHLHSKLLACSDTQHLIGDADMLHSFRVSYKKLRAFLRLVKRANGDQVSITDEVKKCYHELGILRDWQILRERVLKRSDVNELTAVVDYTEEKITEQRVVVARLPVEHVLRESKKEVSKKITASVENGRAQRVIEEERADLARISNQPEMTISDIHRFRKKLKDINYIIDILRSARIHLNADKSEALMKRLGDFNDLCTSIMLLENVLDQDFMFQKVYDEWCAERDSQLREITGEIKHTPTKVSAASGDHV